MLSPDHRASAEEVVAVMEYREEEEGDGHQLAKPGIIFRLTLPWT
jgi:hypothetical protein